MADLMERVAQGALDPVYILSSDQPLLIDRAVRAIADAAVPENARGFNYDVIETRGATASRILAVAQTLPMMAQRRMVLVRDLGPMSAAELGKLIDYLEKPNPTTVLVAITSKLDKRIKLYATAQKRKMLHELAAPRDLAAWVRTEAALRGIDVESGACTRLCDVVGKDLARLALSLEQLGLYAAGRRIRIDDVDDLIADTRERTVFELTEAIGKGDLGHALAAVTALCEQRQSAIGVVVMLARHMRQMGLCYSTEAKRAAKPDLARILGVPPFVVQKLMTQSRRYTPAAVEAALARLSAVDRALKGQNDVVKVLGRELGERVLLDQVVKDIVALGRAA